MLRMLLVACVTWSVGHQHAVSAVSCAGMLGTRKMVLLEKWRPLVVGPLRSLSVEFCADSAVHVQLWRPTESAVDSYTLVWDKLVSPSTTTGRSIVNLTTNEQIRVESDYRLGLQAAAGRESVPVTMRFFKANLVVSARPLLSTYRCVREAFDQLQYPYTFGVELCSELGMS
ncbi:hypothetical protein LSAT2_018271 [Lamellibrachia satsuma]|nr:hypothetical protein LSAT2_018271 [Lamellibrachia satsuma]